MFKTHELLDVTDCENGLGFDCDGCLPKLSAAQIANQQPTLPSFADASSMPD
jgi:hypothetical protein